MIRMARTALALIVAVLVVGAAYLLWWSPPRLDEAIIREAIYTSIQREAAASFYVTGTLEMTATTIVDNTRVLLPDLLPLSLGTSRATVRVPGRVSYGFDASNFDPAMIRVTGDVVDIDIPLLEIHSAEPDLTALEVETSVGWARMQASAQRAERVAVSLLGEALRRQGEAHLVSSNQPAINTARALQALVTTVLSGAGIPVSRVRFHLGEGLLLETDT